MKSLLTRFALATFLCAGSAALSACSSEAEENAVDESQIRDEFAQDVWETVEYTTRGRVLALPRGDDDLQVQHEAIPEFRKPDGFGMPTMPMAFPLDDNVSLEGIAPGDILQITFSVDYKEGWSPLAYRAVAIEKLPQDTVLDLTPPAPEAG
jgi:Cu/Ag efflux protein CusF